MTSKIRIQNLKCGGCAHTIKTRLEAIKGICEVDVNNTEHLVEFNHENAAQLQTVIETLSTLGYPAEGDTNTLTKKAKSYASCAVGRLKT